MSSTYTDSNRLTKQGQGENSNTWGTILNTVLDLVDELSDGIQEVNVSAGNVTLTTNDGSSDQARNRVLKITGQPGAARSVIIPDVEKYYLVRVAVSGSDTVTIRNVSGTGFTVSAGTGNVVALCDGTSTTSMFPAQGDILLKSGNLSGLADTSVARVNLGLTQLAQTSVGGDNKLLGTNAAGAYTSVSVQTPVVVSNGTLSINAATSAAAGIIEVATSAEVAAGTDSTRAVVPSTMKGSIGFSNRYVSSELTMTSGTAVTGTHGLGAVPIDAKYYLVAQTSNLGYAVSDRVYVNDIIRRFGSNDVESRGIGIFANSTLVGAVIGNFGINILNKSTGISSEVDLANWKIVLQAWV